MIINPYVFSIPYDPNAQAFITAAGITDITQQNAINTLVVNLKVANIWNKFKAIYPMIGGTSTTHKFNLINPADSDAAFRLLFSGGWTHSSTGAKPNGSNAKADTFLTPSITLTQNSSHLSYYSRTQSNGTEVEIGSSTGVNASDNKIIVEIRTAGVTYYNINSTSTYITHLDSDSRAFYVGNRTASNVINGWRNGSKLAIGTVLSTPPSTRTINIGCFNSQPAGAFFSTKECAFASIGDGLTDTEVLVFNQIVEGYQYTLGRNVNPVNANYYNTAYNNETNAFLYVSQITDNTQKNAVNTLVNDLKIAGIWTKTKAAYPMIGGTSSTHKWNLVNPQDTDAAFRLTFNGGWTHSSTGATPNGTNAFANTFLVPSSTITLNSMSLSYYSRTNTTPANNSINMGSWVGAGFHYTLLSIRSILSSTTTYGMLQTSGTFAQFLDPNSLGLYTVTRTANNLTKIFKNGILNATNSELSTANSSNSIYLGAANGNTLNYSNRECAFALITDGLTDAEAGNLYTAIQNFNTTLGRQV
jgi:hypothetical protein